MRPICQTILLIGLLFGVTANTVKAQVQVARDVKKLEIAPDSKPIGYITMDGTKQGKFKGDVQGAQKSEIVGFNCSLVKPLDPATGMASGKVNNGPVTITRKNGPSTPQAMQAIATNEMLKSVYIEFTRLQPDGTSFVYYTVKLINAHINRFSQGTSQEIAVLKPGNYPLEMISFSYQRMEVENKEGNTMTVIDNDNQ